MLPWLGAVLVDLLAAQASSGHWGILYGCQHCLAPTFQNHKKNLEEEEKSRNIEIKKCFSFSFLMPCNYGPEASAHCRTSQRPTESNIHSKLLKETALSKNGLGNLKVWHRKKLHRSFGARCHLILFSTKLNYNANTLAEVQSTKLTATKKVS